MYSRIDTELDALIEENVRLQDEEAKLMNRVKNLQAKRKQALGAAGKKLKPVYEDSSHPRHSPTKKRPEIELELQHLRSHIEQSNKKIMELKSSVELSKRVKDG